MSDWSGSYTLAATGAATLITALGGVAVKMTTALRSSRKQRDQAQGDHWERMTREHERMREEIRADRDGWQKRFDECDKKHDECLAANRKLAVDLATIKARVRKLEETSDDSTPRSA